MNLNAWLLWLLWLSWLSWKEHSTMRLCQRHLSINCATPWQNACESDSQRPRHPRALNDKELFDIEG